MTSAYDNLKNYNNGCNGNIYLEVYNISIEVTSLNNSIKFDGAKIKGIWKLSNKFWII